MRAPAPRGRRRGARASPRRAAAGWRRGQPGTGGPCRPRGSAPTARRNRGCATSAPSARGGRPPRRPAPPAARFAAPPHATRSCTLPVSLQARVGHEQLLGSDLGVVEFDRDLQVPPHPRDRPDDPTPEPPLPHALAGPVPRRVLRSCFGELLRRHGPRVPSPRARGAAAQAAALPPAVPQWRRAALFQRLPRQRLPVPPPLPTLAAC